MLDAQFIREHQAEVKANLRNRNVKADVDRVVHLDNERKRLAQETQNVQQRQNEVARLTRGEKDAAKKQEFIQEGKSLKEKATGLEKFISEIILSNVRVLAVDQNIEEKDGQKVVVGKTATIELTPRQTETLALARQIGTISLALRSLLDSQSSTPEGGENRDDKRMNTVRYGVTTQTTR